MRILNLLEVIRKMEEIRIEDKNLKLLYFGTPENVPYKLVLKHIECVSIYDNSINICIK